MQSAGWQLEREEECEAGESKTDVTCIAWEPGGGSGTPSGHSCSLGQHATGKFTACTTDLNPGQMSEAEGGSPAQTEAAANWALASHQQGKSKALQQQH